MDREDFTNEEWGSIIPPNKPDENGKKRKKDPLKKKLLAFGAVVLALCVLLSFISGGAGAYIVMSLFPLLRLPESSDSQGSDIPEYVTPSYESTWEAPVSTVATEEYSSETAPPTQVTQAPTQPPTEVTVTEALPPEKLSKGEIYAQAVDSIVSIKAVSQVNYGTIFGRTITREYESYGSGFFITSNGYILTNLHVVKGAKKITVTTYGGKELTAKTAGSDKSKDIAVLKASGTFSPVTLGDSDSLAVGDDVLVIGNALGQLSYTFTDGVVSHLNRAVSTESGVVINMFQTNAAINQGNSGGPVYDSEGLVVGIASAKYASNTVEGLSFCIPVNDIKQFAQSITK